MVHVATCVAKKTCLPLACRLPDVRDVYVALIEFGWPLQDEGAVTRGVPIAPEGFILLAFSRIAPDTQSP